MSEVNEYMAFDEIVPSPQEKEQEETVTYALSGAAGSCGEIVPWELTGFRSNISH